MEKRRVVITGMGTVNPLGHNVAESWQAVHDGVCGIAPITQYDSSAQKVHLAAEVKDFDVTQYVDKREARRMDVNCHFALAAAQQAVDQAGLKEGNFDPYRTGVIYGSGVGGLAVAEEEIPKLKEKGPGRVSPLCIPEMIANMAAAYISMRFGFKGENFCPVSACATANHSIGEAMRAIRHGYQDIVLCGGTENGIIPIALAGFSNMKALHTGDDPTSASIPFDARRSGFVMGEGAGCLVLESLTHAQARGATILAEVAGYGASGDAYHITSPSPDGEAAARAIRGAIEDAGLTPADVDYINAHGTHGHCCSERGAMGEEGAQNGDFRDLPAAARVLALFYQHGFSAARGADSGFGIARRQPDPSVSLQWRRDHELCHPRGSRHRPGREKHLLAITTCFLG